MAIDHKNYNPDLMAGASETIPDDLTITDTLTVGGATTLTASATGVALDIVAAAATTGTVLDMSDANALTTGTILNATANSSSTGTRSLVFVKNDHASASGTTPLEVVNDGALAPIKTTGAAVSTNYFRFATANGVTIWIGAGTTANGNLTGTAGDICLNGGSNKPEYCTGTTNWTALA